MRREADTFIISSVALSSTRMEDPGWRRAPRKTGNFTFWENGIASFTAVTKGRVTTLFETRLAKGKRIVFVATFANNG